MVNLKRVSFEVAKAIKEAGYPQERPSGFYVSKEYKDFAIGNLHDAVDCYVPIEYRVNAPYVIEVWLWLWREKKIRICLEDAMDSKEPEIERGCYVGTNQLGGICSSQEFTDPEDGIVDIIEHFVKNHLIK